MAATSQPLFRILYACRMAPACEDDVDGVLADILAVAVPMNRALGVTAMLLAHKGWFIGGVEGPDAAVREVVDMIRADDRHQGLHLIGEGAAAERLFPGWSLCARILSDDDAAVLTRARASAPFDAAATPKRTVLRLFAIVAKAHSARFTAQQRLTIRREALRQ